MGELQHGLVVKPFLPQRVVRLYAVMRPERPSLVAQDFSMRSPRLRPSAEAAGCRPRHEKEGEPARCSDRAGGVSPPLTCTRRCFIFITGYI